MSKEMAAIEKKVYYPHRSQEEGHATLWEGVYTVYAQWKALGSIRKQRKEENFGQGSLLWFQREGMGEAE